jgi:multiple sugar transport system substrate-binding protein
MRRPPLTTLLALGLAVLLAPPVAAQQGWDWKKHAGKTVRYVATNFAPTKAIEKQLPRFEQETGIKVRLETLPDDPCRQKLRSEFTAGNSTVDLFHTLVPFDGLQFTSAGWYAPLEEYMRVVPPGYDWDDYEPSTTALLKVGGKTVGVPLHSETQLLMYNKELFQKAGIAGPPRTFEDALAVAAKLHGPDRKIYGAVNRGKRVSTTYTLAPVLYGYGGRWQDESGRITWNTPPAHQAIRMYAELIAKYGPPGVVNYHYQETWGLFAQGRAGFFWDSSSTPPLLEDPKTSQVKGKVGYAPLPAGPQGVHPVVLAWGWSIPAQAPNKEAAWYLIAWLSQKAQVTERAVKDMIFPARKSTWDDPAFKQALATQYPADFVSAFREGLKTKASGQANPWVKATSQVRDLISQVIIAAVEEIGVGRDPMPVIRAKAAETEAEANRIRDQDPK